MSKNPRLFFPEPKHVTDPEATQPTVCRLSAKQPDAAVLKISSTAEYLTAIKMRNRNWGMEQGRDYYWFLFSVQRVS